MPTGAFRLHDGKLGIYVSKTTNLSRIANGDKVRVKGTLEPGGTAPSVMPESITRLGRAPMPVAQPATYAVLASGALDNQWVEIEGVIRAVTVREVQDFAVLDVGVAGGKLMVLVDYDSRENYSTLVDAAVRIRGAVAIKANAQKQILEPSLRVPSLKEIEVLRPGFADPFSIPKVSADRVMRVIPGKLPDHHRVRTAGVVTRQVAPTSFFVRDGKVGLKVETAVPTKVRPGDKVEIAGFPIVKEGMAVFEMSAVRIGGHAEPPEAIVPARMARVFAGRHNANLIRIRATLVDWVQAGETVTLIFQVAEQLFTGVLTLPENEFFTQLENNSVVDVTGICVMGELERDWLYRPRSFMLLVAERRDISLVRAAPWWNPRRLQWALSLVCLILAAVFAWMWALRRQVQRTRTVIEAQARHAAALEERGRIARALHDTLEQGLTGLSLQMKAIESDLSTDSTAGRQLYSARQMLRQSRALARSAIQQMRSASVEEPLVKALQRMADNWNASKAVTVKITIVSEGEHSEMITTHLLGIATESVTNAIKHGQATHVEVTLSNELQAPEISVSDNGLGFDPERMMPHECFGLRGMQERMQEIGGQLEIRSTPGKGTKIIARLARAPTPVSTQRRKWTHWFNQQPATGQSE